ncbi:MAG TPA: rhodanese-like domain-containing protein [Solirubrobacterales bacterium]|jgi:thiosulfate/3-mercaptopyruvate sulfurtransferase
MIDPVWIAARLDDPSVRMIEVDVSPGNYRGGHIPGAILWDAYADLRGSDYLPIDESGLRSLLERSGVSRETTLVFYGYGAALGFWLMSARGHPDVRMLDGPREQWAESGRDWSDEATEVERTSYELGPWDPAISASREDVEDAIGDPETILLDVRSELEFDGERFWPSGATEGAGRAGHLPAAVNIPIDNFRTPDGALRSAAEIGAALEERSVTGDKAIITYCTIANRASQAWAGMKLLLGYPEVSVYYPSWVQWGRESDTPIE